MQLIVLLIVLLNIRYKTTTLQVGMIRNISLILTNTSFKKISETTCDDCVCTMFSTSRYSSIVAFNCYVINRNRAICELFSKTNYQTWPAYQMVMNVSSTFYFLELPPRQQSSITTQNFLTNTTVPTSIIATTALVTTNLGTVVMSNWYGTLSVTMNCVGLIKYAIIQVFVSNTVGLTYSNQYNTYEQNFFNSSYVVNNTFLMYQWAMKSGTTLTCYTSSIQFSAQFNLNGTSHSTVNDTYIIVTVTTTNITNTITGYF